MSLDKKKLTKGKRQAHNFPTEATGCRIIYSSLETMYLSHISKLKLIHTFHTLYIHELSLYKFSLTLRIVLQ